MKQFSEQFGVVSRVCEENKLFQWSLVSVDGMHNEVVS